MEQMLQVGILSSTHGVRGEMKVFPTTDDAARFKKLKSVLLDTGSGLKEMQIEGVKFFKQFVILKFKDHDSINDIERYKGHSIYVTRENAVRLK
nr:16S rRNA processing protein RimM [Lachnospiraceae bacterium]